MKTTKKKPSKKKPSKKKPSKRLTKEARTLLRQMVAEPGRQAIMRHDLLDGTYQVRRGEKIDTCYDVVPASVAWSLIRLGMVAVKPRLTYEEMSAALPVAVFGVGRKRAREIERWRIMQDLYDRFDLTDLGRRTDTGASTKVLRCKRCGHGPENFAYRVCAPKRRKKP